MGIWKGRKEIKDWHPKVIDSTGLKLVRLGSEYGGWVFVEEDSFDGCTLISAGLGEDDSFDVEFANMFKARVLMVDPTPRAIEHFRKLHERIPQRKTVDYVYGGNQPIESYDTQALNPSSFTLEPSALWKRSKRINFFAPPNREHVSYSIVDYQNEYRKDVSMITVNALSFTDLVNNHNLPFNPTILKLDIEGAEIETISHLLAKGHRPNQILVEFDELSRGDKIARKRARRADRILIRSGYSCVWKEKTNLSYYLTP